MQQPQPSEQRLYRIQSIVQGMREEHHLEILRILKRHPAVKLTEIKGSCTGNYVNLSYLEENVVQELEKYVEYIQSSEKLLSDGERDMQGAMDALGGDA